MNKTPHYCPEWDYMLIWDGCPEMEVCICPEREVKTPAADLGYCDCGTCWNIDAMLAEGFAPGCPDCGEPARVIERAEPNSLPA